LDTLPTPPESTSKPSGPSPDDIPDSFMSSHVIDKQTPKYPKEAKKKKISGAVLLSAIVTKQGKMSAIDVIASPDPILSKAATDAVQTWLYEPYLLNGEPIEVDTTITVNFDLH